MAEKESVVIPALEPRFAQLHEEVCARELEDTPRDTGCAPYKRLQIVKSRLKHRNIYQCANRSCHCAALVRKRAHKTSKPSLQVLDLATPPDALLQMDPATPAAHGLRSGAHAGGATAAAKRLCATQHPRGE